MKGVRSLLVFTSLLACTAVSANEDVTGTSSSSSLSELEALARRLEQEDWENVQWYSDQTANSTILQNWTQAAQQVGDRVDEDLAFMWQTAPNTWSAEYWEVFGIFTGIMAGLLVCYSVLCCACCCGSSPSNRQVMDEGDYKDYSQTRRVAGGLTKTGFMDLDSYNAKKQTRDMAEVPEDESLPKEKNSKKTSLLEVEQAAPDSTTKTSSAPQKDIGKIFMEIVDVWSEFLVHQFDRVGRSSTHRRKRDSDYRRHRSPTKRRSSRHNKTYLHPSMEV